MNKFLDTLVSFGLIISMTSVLCRIMHWQEIVLLHWIGIIMIVSASGLRYYSQQEIQGFLWVFVFSVSYLLIPFIPTFNFLSILFLLITLFQEARNIQVNEKSVRPPFLLYTFYLSFGALILGLMLKISHLPGASSLIILSMGLLVAFFVVNGVKSARRVE